MLFVFLPNIFFFVTCCNFHKFVVDITKQFLALKRVIYMTSQRPDFRTSTPLKDAFFGYLWRIKIAFRCESFVSTSEGYSRLKTMIRVL